MARPYLPKSYVVNVNDFIKTIHEKVMERLNETNPDFTKPKADVDIVIPVYQSLPEKTAKHMAWICGSKIYISQKSSFVEYIKQKKDNVTYYIYDKFKGSSHSYRKGYKEETFEIPYPEAGEESIYMPVYWRIN